MKILVTYGSKYGSTRAIAERIADLLRVGGHDVALTDARHAGDLAAYDGVVLGSGIYAGKLHADLAKLLAQQHALAGKKVAAFAVSMSAAEDTPERRAEADSYVKQITSQLDCTHATAFAGVHDPKALPLLVRWLLKAMGTRPGDFRDWAAIEAWAGQVASAWA